MFMEENVLLEVFQALRDMGKQKQGSRINYCRNAHLFQKRNEKRDRGEILDESIFLACKGLICNTQNRPPAPFLKLSEKILKKAQEHSSQPTSHQRL